MGKYVERTAGHRRILEESCTTAKNQFTSSMGLGSNCSMSPDRYQISCKKSDIYYSIFLLTRGPQALSPAPIAACWQTTTCTLCEL